MDLPSARCQTSGGDADNGDRVLFWKVAKKLCSQKRREERNEAMKAYRKSLEPTVVPREILWPSSEVSLNSGAAEQLEKVDLRNLLLPPVSSSKENKTSHETPEPTIFSRDNEADDDQSCVSDVTRELPDIDAPTLYPSLDCLEAELPDLEVSEQLEVSSIQGNPLLRAEKAKQRNDPEEYLAEALTGHVLRRGNQYEGCMEGSSQLGKGGRYKLRDMNNDLLTQNMANLRLESEAEILCYEHLNGPAHNPARLGRIELGYKSAHVASNTSTLPMPPSRRATSVASCNDSQSSKYKRKSVHACPVPPQRKLSFNSQLDSLNDSDYNSSRGDLLSRRQDRNELISISASISSTGEPTNCARLNVSCITPPDCKRCKSTSFATAPHRISKMDKYTSHRVSKQTELEDRKVFGGVPTRQTGHPMPKSGSPAPTSPFSTSMPTSACDMLQQNRSLTEPLNADLRSFDNRGGKRENMAPSWDELGYNTEHRCRDRPRVPRRRNSFSSLMSGDDTSTIATWTLGLYRRRKSVDSTVAPPTTPLPKWADDSPPSRPQRRFSGGSSMRDQFTTTDSAWNCSYDAEPPLLHRHDNHLNFSMTMNTTSTLSSGDRGDGWGNESGTCTNLPNSNCDHHRYQEPPRRRSWCRPDRCSTNEEQGPTELEIQPGVFLPLRGSKETYNAMRRNYVVKTSCLSCEANLVCIADAEYVLCPACKVVSPILTNLGTDCRGGIGLGMEG